MTQVVKGNFTFTVSPSGPKYFWKGEEILGVQRAHILYDEDELRIKLVVSGTQELTYTELVASGIFVKRVL